MHINVSGCLVMLWLGVVQVGCSSFGLFGLVCRKVSSFGLFGSLDGMGGCVEAKRVCPGSIVALCRCLAFESTQFGKWFWDVVHGVAK